MAFFINFVNRLRNPYILDYYSCGITSKQDKLNSTEVECNDFRYSVTISTGIGFIFLGNIYDNIDKPRQVTVVFLLILSVISLIEALFYGQSES